ncbi:uncharacterized protein LOC122079947 [Macadamia integrifolia]|uniref:uncharacterized protein LOC122079947 n=1 Tax=Macadamia integrifolia TaxID=60698 RepID=UPI001C4E556D|nr:uncharacterized protein LOC122079947 [Macadamia integrifolia]
MADVADEPVDDVVEEREDVPEISLHVIAALGGYEVVLGAHWLRTLGHILWDFANLDMKFKVNRKEVALKRITTKPNKVIQDANQIKVDNVRNGQKSNSTFSKVGWNNIKAGLEATFQRPFQKEQLRNKMNKLRGDYNSFMWLLETMRFGWDSNTKTATAADSVWENTIKSGLPWWPELLEVFSDSSARGDRGVSQHIAGNQKSIDIDLDCEDENDKHDSPKDLVGLHDIEPTDVDEVVIRSTTKQKRDRTPTDRRKKSTTKVITKSAHDFSSYVA